MELLARGCVLPDTKTGKKSNRRRRQQSLFKSSREVEDQENFSRGRLQGLVEPGQSLPLWKSLLCLAWYLGTLAPGDLAPRGAQG